MRRSIVRAVVVGALVAAPAAWAQTPGQDVSPLPKLRSDVTGARAGQIRAALEYKAAVERLLELREADVQRATAYLEQTRRLVERGLVARNDVLVAERLLAQAQGRLNETWNEGMIAATIIAKALAQEEVAAAPPPRPGTEQGPPGPEQAIATFVRFRGARPWSLALTRTVEDFFSRTFGRALPVSAFGQTPVHDRLGFDHRNAVDVAVHPDSAEGRAIMAWLRQAGLSFIAFRTAVAGASTGAHIHIGEPSQRLGFQLP
jgi:hypothetical protein